jgi:hypothetical protein
LDLVEAEASIAALNLRIARVAFYELKQALKVNGGVDNSQGNEAE